MNSSHASLQALVLRPITGGSSWAAEHILDIIRTVVQTYTGATSTNKDEGQNLSSCYLTYI